MEYLGSYKITPNVNEIEVDCYGVIEPAQKQTLEQEGWREHCTLEKVEHCEIDITDYLSDGLFDFLNDKVNERNF